MLIVLLTWFGGNYIKNLFRDAGQLSVVEEQLEEANAKHVAEIQKERESRLAAEQNKREADERREHWRQSYYKKDGELRNYKESTRVWIRDHYPDELDFLHDSEDEVRDP